MHIDCFCSDITKFAETLKQHGAHQLTVELPSRAGIAANTQLLEESSTFMSLLSQAELPICLQDWLNQSFKFEHHNTAVSKATIELISIGSLEIPSGVSHLLVCCLPFGDHS
jgi:hypothetical protein